MFKLPDWLKKGLNALYRVLQAGKSAGLFQKKNIPGVSDDKNTLQDR